MNSDHGPRVTARPRAPHPMRPPPPEPTVRGRQPRPAEPAPDPGGHQASGRVAPDQVPGDQAVREQAARARAARAYRRRGLRRLAVLLTAVLGTGWLAYLLLLGSAFGARTVDVAGTVLLSADDVRAAARVPAGRPLLRLDLGAVAGRVRALTPVAAVVVERSWPSTVTIRITERVPLAFAPGGDGGQLVDGTGLRFATVAVPPPGLPELRAADGAATAAAAQVLAAIADPAHQAIRAELVSVQADGPFDVRLGLRGERTVRWGSAENSGRKAAVLAVLLSQPGTVYDVASPDLPTIR